MAATFFAGRPLSGSADRLGLGWVQLARRWLRPRRRRRLRAAYLRHSDLGDAAAELLASIAQQVDT